MSFSLRSGVNCGPLFSLYLLILTTVVDWALQTPRAEGDVQRYAGQN